MKTIHFTDEHRRRHFDFFRKMAQPHFNICARVEIGRLLPALKEAEKPFTPSIVYCISRTANEIPVFRQRIRGDEVVEHEAVHPSFTVRTQQSDVFSFCETPYQTDYPAFVTLAQERMQAMQHTPSMEDIPGRDDYLYLSAIPWISFTSLQHAMHNPSTDSVPRITWGKFFDEGARVWLPLSVQAHHGLVDGRHMGEYFENIQQLFAFPEIFL
ncbi:MAG: chloramphenicol acetyltransferase [Phaeodactylibacter sp.]|nr:chloramphenicol acetyltransferase [Phaeodactylibacter sp.]